MSARAARVSKLVSDYDNTLYAVSFDGKISVWRRGPSDGASDNPAWWGIPSYILRSNPQFLFALTDNLKLDGNPIDIGLERILVHLRGMDAWRATGVSEERRKYRDDLERDKERQTSNTFRGIAADARRDFAKAAETL